MKQVIVIAISLSFLGLPQSTARELVSVTRGETVAGTFSPLWGEQSGDTIFFDDFDDGQIDPAKWVFNPNGIGGSVTELLEVALEPRLVVSPGVQGQGARRRALQADVYDSDPVL